MARFYRLVPEVTRAEYRAVYLAAKQFVTALKVGEGVDDAVDRLVELVDGIPPQRMYDPNNPRQASAG